MKMGRTVIPCLAATAAVFLGALTAPDKHSDQSYGVGYFLGEETRTGLTLDGIGGNTAMLINGFRDGLAGADPLFPQEEMDGLLESLHAEMATRMVARRLETDAEFKRIHDENHHLSRRFAEAFGKQKGVVTLPSGAQYLVLRVGSGRTPLLDDTVVLNGKMQLLDGTVLVERTGMEMAINTASRGGSELLRRMKVGARWQVAIPPELAYGAGGRFPDIGPNQTIVGIVELREVR